MQHELLGPGFAVEIKGVDLSQAQSDETVRQMRDLWLEHKVAVFRDQALEDKDLIRFAEYFGPTYVYVRDQFNDRQRPVITIISNIEEDGRKLGDLGDGEVHWHTDQAYSTDGSFGTILYGVEIPEDGGATCYGDLAQAERPAGLHRRQERHLFDRASGGNTEARPARKPAQGEAAAIAPLGSDTSLYRAESPLSEPQSRAACGWDDGGRERRPAPRGRGLRDTTGSSLLSQMAQRRPCHP